MVIDEGAAMAGFQVDPDTVRAAAPGLRECCDEISSAAGLVNSVSLPAAAMGGVDAAGEFAAAVRTLVSEHGSDLEHGALWVDAAEETVVKAAESYEEMDRQAVDRFTRLLEE